MFGLAVLANLPMIAFRLIRRYEAHDCKQFKVVKNKTKYLRIVKDDDK